MSALERIEELIIFLPARDIPKGNTFLSIRDFTSLDDLVSSAIYRVEKSQTSSFPKEEYNNIDLDLLNTLKAEIRNYVMQMGIPDIEENLGYSYTDFPDDVYEDVYNDEDQYCENKLFT